MEIHPSPASLPMKELKKRLADLEIDFRGCTTKQDFLELLEKAEAPRIAELGRQRAQQAREAEARQRIFGEAGAPEVHAPGSAVALNPNGPAPTSIPTVSTKDARREQRAAAKASAKGNSLIQEIQDEDGAVDMTTMKNLGTGGVLGRGHFFFRGHSFWQEMMPEHVATPGLEFRVGLDDGRNYARLPGGATDYKEKKVGENDTRYLEAAMCLPQGRSDEAEVEKVVLAAASWADRSRLRRLLASCFVSQRVAGRALCEAAGRGHEEIVTELLRARAAAAAVDGAAQKTALHFSCEQGHEAVAGMLLAAGASLKDVDSTGRTPCDLAREQDLGMMAKRLERSFA